WLMKEHGFSPQRIASASAYMPGRFVNPHLKRQFPGVDFGKGFGEIKKGFVGSLTVLNLKKTTTVLRDDLRTKVKWSPLEGRMLPGALEAVFVRGVRY
ncbi:amidohydrolase, partial [Candidatus Kaiserbacteria bacterium]|nr:amidohydrolase [Candidatus Kaiserbacteria bacterium]